MPISVPPSPGATRAADIVAATREQLGVALGLTAAVTWTLLGLESTVRGGERHVRDVLWNIPWVFTMATFAIVYLTQRHAFSRRQHLAAYALAASMVAVLAGNIGVITDNDALGALGFPLGPTVWVAAMVAFGVATMRAGVLSRRTGWAIVLLEPLSIVAGVALSPIAGLHDRGNFSGAIEKGIVLWLIAVELADRARALGGSPRSAWLPRPSRFRSLARDPVHEPRWRTDET